MNSNDYQPEPAGGHEPGPHVAIVTIDADTLTRTAQLLEVCDGFLRAAGPDVSAELHDYLAGRTAPIDLGLFIDTLGMTGLLLRDRLPTAAAERTGETTEAVTA